MGIRPSSFVLRPPLSLSDDQTEAADDGLLPGLVAALAATQVAGLVDHHFVRFPHLIALLWVVAALAVTVAGQQSRAAAPGIGRNVTRAAAPSR